MASLCYFFLRDYGPYEEVSYVFPTFFWRLRKRGRSYLDFTFGFLRNQTELWISTPVSVLIRANINISIETICANGRKNNKHKRNVRRLLDPIRWRIFWSGTYRTIELTNDDIFMQKAPDTRKPSEPR